MPSGSLGMNFHLPLRLLPTIFRQNTYCARQHIPVVVSNHQSCEPHMFEISFSTVPYGMLARNAAWHAACRMKLAFVLSEKVTMMHGMPWNEKYSFSTASAFLTCVVLQKWTPHTGLSTRSLLQHIFFDCPGTDRTCKFCLRSSIKDYIT